MKKTRTTAWTNAMIQKQNDEFYIVEIGKKDEPDRVYSLSEELAEWTGIDGVSVVIKMNEEISPEEQVLDEF